MKFNYYLFLLITLFWSGQAFARTQPPGAGTLEDPYQISELDHLKWLSLGDVSIGFEPVLTSEASDNRFSAHYILMEDIDCSGWDEFEAIGGTGVFSGTFNGNAHTISNLLISKESATYNSFFTGTSSNTVIKKLGLIDVSVSGAKTCAALIGRMGSGHVSEVYVTGTVSQVTTDSNPTVAVGGMIGALAGGIVEDCFADVAVTGKNCAGFIGTQSWGEVTTSYSIGSVTATETAHGFSYSWDGSISQCYWDKETSGVTTSRGLDDAYGLTTAEFASHGNFIGFDFDMVWEMANGRPQFLWGIYDVVLTVRAVPEWAMDYVGGFGGYNEGDSFNPMTGAPGVGPATGYKFVKFTADDDPTYENTAPMLFGSVSKDMPQNYVAHFEEDWAYENGDGTAQNPYQITSARELEFLSNIPALRDQHFILMNDLDINVPGGYMGEGFTPIGNEHAPFEGTFNGNGHTISGLYIDRPGEDNVGLFGLVKKQAQITQLAVKANKVNGANNVGILVGKIEGAAEVSFCYTLGSVDGEENTGGLIGLVEVGSVKSCYSGANVSGANYVGGVIGTIKLAVADELIAFGEVSGANTGGVVAMNDQGVVLDVFWDKELTNQTTSSGSMDDHGLTTVEMADQANFINFNFNANWEMATIEDIDSNQRPYLQWQLYDSFITVQSNFALGVKSLSGEGGIAEGAEVTLSVEPQFGYRFVEWIVDGAAVSEVNHTFTFQAGMSPVIELVLEEDFTFSGGDGSFNSPYQITTLEQLAYLSYVESIKADNFIIMNDIDASETADWHSGDGFLPIRNVAGQIDGGGNQISGLVINRPAESKVGFIGEGVEVFLKNLHIVDAEIKGWDYVGGLVGITDAGTIENVSFSGSIEAKNYAGGLIGKSGEAFVTKSFTAGILRGQTYLGGFVGHAVGTIEICYSNMDVVDGYAFVGGFIGQLDGQGQVLNAFATGKVQGSTIIENTPTGAFAGAIGDGTPWSWTFAANVYATGEISGLPPVNDALKGLAGLGAPGNSYFDRETTKVTPLGGDSSALFTSEFGAEASFIGWDFDNTWEITTLTSIDSNPRPYLKAFAFHAITVDAGANGSISPVNVSVPNGEDQTFTIIPSDGYHIATLSVDGVEIDVVDTYTFTNVTTSHTIAATFEINEYAFNIVQEGEGFIKIDDVEVSGDISVNHGTKVYLEFKPEAGYSLGAVMFNEVEIDQDEFDISGGVYSWTTPAFIEASSFKVVFDRMLSAGVEVAPVVYPNPTKGQLNITSLTAGAEVKVLNASGQLVFSTIATAEEMKLSLAHYPNGLYHVVVEGKGSFKVIKD
ncbi:InlB B-repeat-containing protein [Persicobacter diffluens]|uniref:GLUG domain-containing protein n=1 Tax=Persicobacter diffluens TaxID=981 RepID=A0AAN5AN46_9BACT|nr:hypothetical protein PEDI_35630 [Persicobacter diffluens]